MNTVLVNSGGPGSSITLDPEIVSMRDSLSIDKKCLLTYENSLIRGWRNIINLDNSRRMEYQVLRKLQMVCLLLSAT